MTTLNQELYEALVAAGAPDDAAKRAAASVLSQNNFSQLATKEDIAALRAATKEDITQLDKRLVVVETRLATVEKLLWAVVLGVIALVLRAFWPVVAA